MLLVRLVGNDTWVVPYNNPRARHQHPYYPPVSKTPPPSEARAVTPEASPQIPRRASFGGLEEPETSPQRATGLAARNKFLRLTIRLPCAVKFLGFLGGFSERSPLSGVRGGAPRSSPPPQSANLVLMRWRIFPMGAAKSSRKRTFETA